MNTCELMKEYTYKHASAKIQSATGRGRWDGKAQKYDVKLSLDTKRTLDYC